MNKLIIISGCSGGGKSTLVSELSNIGYSVIPEVGRVLVKEQIALNSGITPWQNPLVFCEMLIERSVAAYHQAEQMKNVKKQFVFLDRSFLEGVSYYRTLKIKDSAKYDHLISYLRYYPTVFMTPPWEEIFIHDDERKHSFDEAGSEYQRLLKAYPRYGYSLVELPKVSVKERVEFLLSNLQDNSKS